MNRELVEDNAVEEYLLLISFAEEKFVMKELGDKQGVTSDTISQWKYKIRNHLTGY